MNQKQNTAMKKFKGNELSRTQLKAISGGLKAQARNLCATGDYNNYEICNNCCITYMSDQDSPPTNADGEPDIYGFCDFICTN
ncbi:hypothetical protein M2347_003878 [Chryseobacterium sp. H1D6B]|uniref:hypothetical protein n=1 Tax=Chryseobacterium sp. H1D6B TaxID=2940588 RepID=UPI0015CE317F|nr:hypothetical protein [Chryseobacterium sp. H1D6B]MDH6254151.1 hypothetical protein [Chryseobacterium sp. H1D6B]